MKSLKNVLAFILMAMAISLPAFAQSYGGGVYAAQGARSAQQVQLGTVYAVRNVTIEPQQQGFSSGAVIGGAIGAALGASMARKSNMVVQAAAATATGAIGVAAGQAVERRVSTASAVEIVVRLDDGRLMALSQGNDEGFREGQKVMLISGTTGVRLTAAPNGV